MPNLIELAGNIYRQVKAKYLGKWYNALILEDEYQQNKRTVKRKTPRKELEKKLDEVWSKKVKDIGKCQRCGTTTNLQAHHIERRSHKSTRWELDNGVCLCMKCHLYWAHKENREFEDWIRELIGDQLRDRLAFKSMLRVKYSIGELEYMLERLQDAKNNSR